MRKYVKALGIIIMCGLLVCACSDNNKGATRIDNANSVDRILQERMAEEDKSDRDAAAEEEGTEKTVSINTDANDSQTGPGAVSENDKEPDAAETTDPADGTNDGNSSAEVVKGNTPIDIDLTQLSGNMVYSEVYYMMVTPENYIGKCIRMEGQFSVYHDEVTDKYYYACIIKDATACCASGIEFELSGDYKYPKDYPAEGAEIEVTGIFDTYEEDGNYYCVLRKAVLGSQG